ncbi:energy transducer TonB [Duncaniella sp.]|uniref:energy transducer TonB family protein n=1 Tax=Duncaniella sp. TaxID=2518496 RepID=UPI0023D4FF79|nr:energy transducer TonB [Duncaniella sp.]MDE5905366.1 energy transducer TonB [Duncaniella sp.]
MKKLLLVAVVLIQSCMTVFAQQSYNDSIYREIRFPLAESDTNTVFYYFNDEWIPGLMLEMVEPQSIEKIEIKNDSFGNQAVFFTLPSEALSQLKSKVDETRKQLFENYDPICEFPGGNGLLKEWLNANIRIPEGYKGHERVVVLFKVQPDGEITDAKMLKQSKNEAVNEEALRLVGEMPKFRVKYYTPKKMPVGMALPIVFKDPNAIYIR